MNYIIHPICGEAWCKFKLSNLDEKASINEDENYIPKLLINLDIPKFDISLSQIQYNEIQNLLEFFHNYTKSYPFLKYRPQNSITTDPESWWLYLYQVTQKKNNQKLKWTNMKKFIEHRKLYVKLWRHKKLASLVKEKFVCFFLFSFIFCMKFY